MSAAHSGGRAHLPFFVQNNILHNKVFQCDAILPVLPVFHVPIVHNYYILPAMYFTCIL